MKEGLEKAIQIVDKIIKREKKWEEENRRSRHCEIMALGNARWFLLDALRKENECS